MILAPAPGPHLFLRPYLARGTPLVAINRMIADVDVPAVLPENAGYNACNYNDGLPVTIRFADKVGDIL